MITTLANPYLAQNAGRRYPLADDTTGLADTSILEARFTVTAGGYTSPVTPLLCRVESTSAGGEAYKRITVVLESGGVEKDSLYFDIPATMSTNAPYTAMAFSSGAFGELTVTASVLSEKGDTLRIPFALTTVVFRAMGVDSIQGIGATDFPASEVLQGPIVLDMGKNTDPYLDGQHIRLDILKGAGIGEKCQDAAIGQTCDKVLFTVNGERPGSDGELRLVGAGGVTITPLPDEHAIVIALDTVALSRMTDTCEPAC